VLARLLPVKDPLLAPLVAVAGGILLSRLVGFDARELTLALLPLFALTLLSMRRSRALAFAACLITLIFAGALLDVLHRPSAAPTIDASSQETVLLEGCVIEPSISYEGRDQFTVELAPKAAARVSLAMREGETPPDLRYGQRVAFEARVRAIRNFRNPGSFDYIGYSARRNIYWTASARAGAEIRMLPGRCGSRFFALIFGLRTAALLRLETLYAGNAYATGMMEAILIGESGKLEKLWTDHFRRTGTYHALVISGLHISVLAAFLLFLLRLCFVPEFPALLTTCVAAWTYALVSGWTAPVVRAAGGFTLYLIGRYFYRRRRLINLLCAVALVYLIWDPGQMFDASFQLSFLSVTAIAALAAPLLEATSALYGRALRDITNLGRDPRHEPRAAQFRVELRLLAQTLGCYVRFLRSPWTLRAMALSARLALYVYDMVVISTAVQIGLALPMAIYFHRISFSGLSANVIIVPLLSAVVPVGFIAIFTGWRLPALIAQWLLIAAEKVANWHVRWEPDWRVPDPPLWLSLAFVASLLALTFALRMTPRWRWPAFAAVLALFALVFRHPFPPRVEHGKLELSAIDVGQGDSLLVAFPDGKLMLVDGGGFPNFGGKRPTIRMDIGEDVISPYLWSRSIRKLDVVVATHAHEDHTGGLPALIDNFHPTELWTGANSDSPVWEELRAKARSRGVRIVAMQAGRAFDFGGAHVEALSPPADYEPARTPKNNDSLALRLNYGERSVLLTGDMEWQMEARLIYDGRLRPIDVLKVGHHGSKTSSSEPFLDALRPAVAVISDGFENSFHHPHPDVLARLEAHHAEILRTDRLGLITIRTDGRRLSIEAEGLPH
jgi:competence protein ComEC